MRALRPARTGGEFVKLWTASAVSNVGDGVTLVAGPLLVARLTDDPLPIAGSVFVQQAPWLLFSLVSGVYADRLDRRRLIVGADLARTAALVALTVAIATGTASVPLVYAVFFLLGTGETVADTAASARLPQIVPAEALPVANARLTAAFVVGNQLLSKPLGAWLFVTAAALPFAFDAATFLVAALLATAMRPTPPPEPGGPGERGLAEGVRRLWDDVVLRTNVLALGAANVVLCAASAVLVLYARERLGVGESGYGVLLLMFGVGGVLGTALTGRLPFRTATLLRAGLAVETATHAGLALATAPWQAGAVFVVFGVNAMVWGAVSTGLVQSRVPNRTLGRVTGVHRLVQMGGAALGSLLGGLLARELGVTGPYWVAFAVMVAVTAVTWRPFGRA
ncbi:MFS transporter [Actinomadura kijaniata]|uniref:MFS transporter n=1 Tax=Actinomadura kijaniata TaxID=46161 RepID=UPI003F1ABA3E